MSDKTEKELMQEVHQAVFGVKNTDERGISGDIKEIKEHIIKQNGRIKKNTIAIIFVVAFLSGIGVLEAQEILQLFGG